MDTLPEAEMHPQQAGGLRTTMRLLPRVANYGDTSAGWSDAATVANIGSPRPNAGEGPGGEGDASLLIQVP